MKFLPRKRPSLKLHLLPKKFQSLRNTKRLEFTATIFRIEPNTKTLIFLRKTYRTPRKRSLPRRSAKTTRGAKRVCPFIKRTFLWKTYLLQNLLNRRKRILTAANTTVRELACRSKLQSTKTTP